MAAGEYVSVSSQADTEAADMTRERKELAEQPEAELDELTTIYVKRGVVPLLARKVAEQMTARDAFAAHARDELGLAAHVVAQPVQTALTSAATFTVGAAFPLIVWMSAPARAIPLTVSIGRTLQRPPPDTPSASPGSPSAWYRSRRQNVRSLPCIGCKRFLWLLTYQENFRYF